MIQTGYILLTDISGYTMFLTQSELDHANDILQQLFNKQLVHITAPLILSNLQGDAILSYLPDSAEQQPQTVIETIERLYYDFRRLLELMKVNSSCTCNACVNMGTLDLKVFLNHGSFMLQEVGGKTELVGSDVILAHRMMKNSVKEKTGLNGYALITDAALQKLGGETLVKPLTPHEEEYEHIGTVKMHIYSLQAKWKAEREKERAQVDSENAWVSAAIDLPASAEAAWTIFVDPELGRQWIGLDTFTRIDTLGGRVQTGTEMHCVHDTSVTDYLIVDWNPDEFYYTSEGNFGGLLFRLTYGLRRKANQSQLYVHYATPSGGDGSADIDMLQSMMQGIAATSMTSFARVLQEQIDRGKIILTESPVEDRELVPPAPMKQ